MQLSMVKTLRKNSLHNQMQVKSSVNLHQLKKTTQNFPFLHKQMQSSERDFNQRYTQSRGKLRTGSTAKPLVLLAKQRRKDPFHKQTAITEDVLNKKGLCQLTSMGIINKQVDCYQLLNLRYDVEPKLVEPSNTFLTNPAILISTYYQKTRNDSESIRTKEYTTNLAKRLNSKVEENKIIKEKSSDKKIRTTCFCP